MPEPCDDFAEQFRAILDRAVTDMAALGLEGGVAAAQHAIAFHMVLRLESANTRDHLEQLRDEIDDYLEVADEPPTPFLRLVQ